MPGPPHQRLKETVRFYGQVEGERLVSNSPDAVLRDTKGGSPGTRSNALTGLPSSGPLGEPAFENVFPFMRIVLIFCIAGRLFFVPRARQTLGAYRIPLKAGLLTHLINASYH